MLRWTLIYTINNTTKKFRSNTTSEFELSNEYSVKTKKGGTVNITLAVRKVGHLNIKAIT